MSNITTRNDLKQLASNIEVIAREVQFKLDTSTDFMDSLAVANELVRNNLTFVFSLGEVFASEQGQTTPKKRVSVSHGPFHRDNLGRFARKV